MKDGFGGWTGRFRSRAGVALRRPRLEATEDDVGAGPSAVPTPARGADLRLAIGFGHGRAVGFGLDAEILRDEPRPRDRLGRIGRALRRVERGGEIRGVERHRRPQ